MKVNKEYNPVEIIQTDRFLGELAQYLSQETLVVTSPGFIRRGIISQIQKLCPDVIIFSDVKPNPELKAIDAAVTELRLSKISNIVAIGGGSVIDTAKAFALALKTDLAEPLRENLIKNEKQNWSNRVPLIAIPTTSGTGSEVTPFATIWDADTNKKFSLNTDLLYPDIAILDPTLTQSLPAELTLYTGLDAVSHALESLWNKNKNSESEKLAIHALTLISNSFTELMNDLTNLKFRREMQLGSTYAGLAISHTRTAIAHSISYPLTSHFGVPHGLACSFTLEIILENHLNEIGETASNRQLLDAVLVILKSFKLKEEILKHVSPTQIESVKSEMISKERAGNYLYEIDGVEKFLEL